MLHRDSYFDNAKFLLIFLVVFGHLIQQLTKDSATIQTLYYWIYIFHMPAFIFLSGFFAKGIGNKKYILKLVKKLLLPYVIFQVFYSSYYVWLGVESWDPLIMEPRWSLWFLLSLFSWHMLLILFKRIPAIYGIPLAFSIGIAIGYVDTIGHELSLSRTIVFFPFFLLGYWVTKERLYKLKNNFIRVSSLVLMSVVAVAIALTPDFSIVWLFGSSSYQALGLPGLGGLVQFGIYLLSTLMAASVLVWIPSKQKMFTFIGQQTIYVYLLHGIFIHFFRQGDYLKFDHAFDLVGLVILSVAIVALLASKPVRTLTQPFIEGDYSMLKGWFSNNSNRKQRNVYVNNN